MRRKEYHDKTCNVSDAGWSSLVARRAHNPKVVGSNPAPATTFKALVHVGAFLFFIESTPVNLLQFCRPGASILFEVTPLR